MARMLVRSSSARASGVGFLRREPSVERGGQRGVLPVDFHGFARLLVGVGELDLRPGRLGPARDRPEVLLDLLFGVLGIEVAGQREDRVVRHVVGVVKLPELFQRGLVDVLHAADGHPGIRTAGEHHLGKLLEQAAVGLVVVGAAAFLLDDLALGVHADLLHLAVPHAFALDPEREAHVVGGQVEVEVGAVEAGGGVQTAARAGDELVQLAAGDVVAALEHQVLEEVRETRAVGTLVLAADVVEHVAGNDRDRVVGREDDVQAVGQVVLGELHAPGGHPGRRQAAEKSGNDAGDDRAA